MSVFKIGFHTGPGGNADGIGDYFKALNSAGIKIFLKSCESYGPIFELLGLSPTDFHTTIYRMSTQGQGDGFDYDVPPYKDPVYTNDPEGAATRHYLQTIGNLPPEFDKRTWVEPINEIDKNFSDWLGLFAVKYANLAMADGYKTTMFGWSSGEPEPEHWETPGMLEYLKLCADNPTKVAVSLHEYSLTVDDIFDGYPFKIGRFMYLLATCDKHKIGRPTIHISEWGWTLNHVPTPEEATPHIIGVENSYYSFDAVDGASIWWLGPGFEGIADEVQKLISVVQNLALTISERGAPANTIPELPVPDGSTWKQYADPDPNPGENILKVTQPVNFITSMRGFGKNQPTKLRFAPIYNDGASNVNGAWVDIDISEFLGLDMRGWEFISRVPMEFEVDCGTLPPPDPNPDPDPLPPTYPTLVSDVSHWQGAIDFGIMRSKGVQALMIKATESTNFIDPSAQTYYNDALASGFVEELTTFYHFYRFNKDPVAQAEYFVNRVKQITGGVISCALVVDMEDTIYSAIGKDNEFKLFMDTLEFLSGFRPVIYTASWWWTVARWGKKLPWVDRYALVEAEYRLDPPSPTDENIDLDYVLKQLQGQNPTISSEFSKWWFWQFTSKVRGKDFGVASKNVDMQFVNGGPVELKFVYTLEGSVTVDPRPSPIPDPQPGNIDALAYLRAPDGYMSDNDAVVFTQAYNTQWEDPDESVWNLVKGSDNKGWTEQYYTDGTYIYRTFDTSENSDLGWWYAQFTNGVLGAIWLPRYVQEGATYVSDKQVEHYTNPCEVRLPLTGVTDTLKVVKLHSSVVLPSGKTLEDVLELYWVEGQETYYFGKNRGLVGFMNSSIASGWTSDLSGRPPMTWTKPTCLGDAKYFK